MFVLGHRFETKDTINKSKVKHRTIVHFILRREFKDTGEQQYRTSQFWGTTSKTPKTDNGLDSRPRHKTNQVERYWPLENTNVCGEGLGNVKGALLVSKWYACRALVCCLGLVVPQHLDVRFIAVS